ncbi:uroporphyrinogen-III synthase [Alkalihalobacterium elongatum]|uniref:uroporphyrinogen-III synthase n=1 Tax=Alkalihalobacterium elongatum TaxID=2675466 RepID=UPI001C1FE9AA|nr:uroporphyrinogen-III synthase [Alkalihalobacterium elongatum]
MKTELPLAGVTIGVTRAKEQSRSFINKIESQGGVAVAVPLLEFQPPQDKHQVMTCLSKLHTYDWLIITSANGVHFFLKEVQNMDKLSILKTKNIAVVGSKTEEVLQSYGLQAALLPEKFVAESLLETLQINLKEDNRVLIVKGNLARDVIYDGLQKAGFTVDEVTVYETVENKDAEEDLLHMLSSQSLNYLTFTSPSTVQNFIKIIKKHTISINDNLTFVCIGPITAQEAQKSMLQPLLVAEEYTTEGMIEEMIKHKGRQNNV